MTCNPALYRHSAGADGAALVNRFDSRDGVNAYRLAIYKKGARNSSGVRAYMMLAQNLVYTAITRGKRLVVIVGQRRAMAIAVRSGGQRRIKLREWLTASKKT